MIDHEKLKLAHELAKEYKEKCNLFDVIIVSTFQVHAIIFHHELKVLKNECSETECSVYITIDALIAKLKELLQSKNKYQIGQDVWVLGLKGGFHKTKIKAINDDGYMVFGGLDLIYSENDLYLNKESLIEAQNEYWSSLLESKESTICPKCGEKRVNDGMCWKVGCDYHQEIAQCGSKGDGR